MYINGNYVVNSLPKGGVMKRVLRVNENFNPQFPDSIDLKITNSCSEGCSFCHEKSIPGGPSFNLDRTIKMLSDLPKVPIEVAVGGGNVMDCLEDTIKLLQWMTSYGFKPRVTISNRVYKSLEDIIKSRRPVYHSKTLSMNPRVNFVDLVPFFGVSTMEFDPDISNSDYIVWHVIVGITPLEEVKKMLDAKFGYNKILFLGMKQFGRAKSMIIPDLTEWKKLIGSYVHERVGEKTIGFDNLALEQLEIKKVLTNRAWSSLWFGPEFSSSMYVDAVEETFAPTSTSTERVSWDDYSIVDYFKKFKNDFSD